MEQTSTRRPHQKSSTAMRTPEEQHAAIARLSASLPVRPDAEHLRELLAAAFIAHIEDLWPAGRDQGSPEWITVNVDSILATIERLYLMALEGYPGAGEFFDRMRWLPALVDDIDAQVAPRSKTFR